jgi:hypothetical protein
MEPFSILGLSLASIIAGEALLAKISALIQSRRRRIEPELVSSQV